VIYKVSYVVVGGSHPGAIINEDEPPKVGDQVRLNGEQFEVVEVVDLLPPRDNFAYLHVTCEPIEEAAEANTSP
jgi:hypothetical protein